MVLKVLVPDKVIFPLRPVAEPMPNVAVPAKVKSPVPEITEVPKFTLFPLPVAIENVFGVLTTKEDPIVNAAVLVLVTVKFPNTEAAVGEKV